jgi:hypothetical protein
METMQNNEKKIAELVKKMYEPSITDDYRMERQYATIITELTMAESPEK